MATHPERKDERSGRLSSCSFKRLSLTFLISIMVAFVAIYCGLLSRMKIEQWEWREEMLKRDVGPEGVALFDSFDRNGDGYLSLSEFEPLIDRLVGPEISSHTYDEEIDPAGEVIFLQSHFESLKFESMSIDMDRWSYTNQDSPVSGLRNWKRAAIEIKPFGVSMFKAFLPDDVISVGDVYTIVSSNLNYFSSTLSSNRFFPPRVRDKEIAIHQLLSMFHARPFVHTRFGPQGSVALVRAENEQFVDIVFRIHAEFQLNEPPIHPFWFTPAQFTGNIVIRRDASHIHSFHMYVPTDQGLNVDMEWLNGPTETENMEVDIGFLPRMELQSDAESVPVMTVLPSGEKVNILENEEAIDLPSSSQKPIRWNSEIDLQKAFTLLERNLYPFKKIPYLPYLEALKVAEIENKLVHLILLWGALDDQSC